MSGLNGTPDAYVPDWLGRLADANKRVLQLEEENAALVARCRSLEKQRDRAEQKYDGACAMMTASVGPIGWEVFTAGDGEKSLAPVNWRKRALAAEARLKRGGA